MMISVVMNTNTPIMKNNPYVSAPGSTNPSPRRPSIAPNMLSALFPASCAHSSADVDADCSPDGPTDPDGTGAGACDAVGTGTDPDGTGSEAVGGADDDGSDGDAEGGNIDAERYPLGSGLVGLGHGISA